MDGRPPTAVVERQSLDVIVKASGEIRAADSSTIVQKMNGAASIEFIIEEGIRVTNGQVVAEFNTEDIENRIRNMEAELDVKKTALEAKETALEIQLIDNEKNLRKAAQAVEAAGLELDKLLKGDAPLRRNNADSKVQTTERELSISERRVREIRGLLKEGFVTEDQVEEEEINHQKASVAFETAKEEFRMLKQYTLPLDETKARNALSEAKAELEKTRKSSAAHLRQKRQEVSSAKLAVTMTGENLEDAREQLGLCVIHAPTEGVVTYADARHPWRKTQIHVGAKIHPGQTIMTIPDTGSMQAIVNVSEADIRKLAREQKVTLTVEAAGGLQFEGTIKRVAEVANTGGWWGTDVKEFEVEISIEDAADLKPGFSCAAEILVARVESALTIPVQAVFGKASEAFVYRRKDRAIEKIPVSLGDASEERVAIVSGLKAGDIVLMSEPAGE